MQPNVSIPRIPPYLSLDLWRGIAILWVVMVHSCLAYISSGHTDALQNPIYAISVKGQLGVVLFFVISGYCISGAAYGCITGGKSMGRYVSDRIRRIYPPYLLACVVALAIGLLTTFLQKLHVMPMSKTTAFQIPHDLGFWLANLTLTQTIFGKSSFLFVAWSLCYEVAFYLIMGIFLAVSKLAFPLNVVFRARFFLHACGAMTIVSLVWQYISPLGCPFPLNLWYQFGFGTLLFALVAEKNGHSRDVWPKFFGVVCFLIAISFAYFRASQFGDLAHPSTRLQVVVCLSFFSTLLLLHKFDGIVLRAKWLAPLLWLGTISYSVYLIHTVVIAFPDAGLRRLGFDGPRYIITYFVQILTSVAAGWVFYMLIERRFISVRQVKRIDSESI